VTDEVTLTLPRERAYYPIAQLVLGGLAARHDVTLERLEDLELALGGVLDRLSGEEPAMVRLRVADERVIASVGPLDHDLRAELEREAGGTLDLRRLLDTVADGYELVERDGADWIDVAKAFR
jgi:hypothetical protein